MSVGFLGSRWAKCAQALSLLLGFIAAPAAAQFLPSNSPRAEVFGGVSYFNPNGKYLKSDTSKVPSMFGWGGSIYAPFSESVGAVVDFSGQYGSGGSFHDLMGGAEYKPRKWALQPFGEVMMGWARRSPKTLPVQGSAAFAVGGGLDLHRTGRFSVRLVRVDYVHSLDNPGITTSNDQTFWNSIRIQSGVIMTFGGPPQETLVAAVCTTTPEKVRAGEPVAAKLTPKGFARRRNLVYEWQVNDAKLGSTSADAVIETASLTPGNYTVKGTASNNGNGKHHASASCTATFAVLELPKQETPATTESQPTAETAKTEAQPATENATAKTESQPAAETATTKPDAQPAAAPATATPEPATAQPSAPSETTASDAAQKPATTSEPQSAPAAAPEQSTPAPANEAQPAQSTPSTNSAPSTETPQASAAPTASTKTEAASSEKKTLVKQQSVTGVAEATQPAPATSPNVTRADVNPTPRTTTATAHSKRAKQKSTAKNRAASKPTPSPVPEASTTATEAPKQATVVATPSTVHSGEPATVSVHTDTPETTTADAVCTTSAGTLHPDHGNMTLDTAGVRAGKVTISCTQHDGKPVGTTVVEVIARTNNTPEVRKLNSVRFNDAKRPARVDNVAKQILRDAAHALQQSDPGSKLILVGNAQASELQSGKNLAERRADNAKAFLMDKQNGGGVDASSITVHNGKANARRVDIYLAAPGATSKRAGKTVNGGVEGRSTGKQLHKHGMRVVEK